MLKPKMGHQKRKTKVLLQLMTRLGGVKENGPHEPTYEEELIWLIHSASISAVTKLEIIQHAVATSPKVCINAHGIQFHPCWFWAVR